MTYSSQEVWKRFDHSFMGKNVHQNWRFCRELYCKYQIFSFSNSFWPPKKGFCHTFAIPSNILIGPPNSYLQKKMQNYREISRNFDFTGKNQEKCWKNDQKHQFWGRKVCVEIVNLISFPSHIYFEQKKPVWTTNLAHFHMIKCNFPKISFLP